MSISPYVTVNITRDTVGASTEGFGTPLLLSANADFAERTRTYGSLAEVAEDFPITTGPEYLAAQALFSQDRRPEQIKIGRCALKPTQRYALSIPAITVGAEIELAVAGEGLTTTEISITPLADLTFTTAHASETLTSVAHGMVTGDGPYRLTNAGGALPTGLAVDTDYWIIRLTADTYQLAASYADAIAETEVTFSSDGTGTHTLQRDANDVMISQLVDRLNSVAGAGSVYSAVRVNGAGDTDTMTVTGFGPGLWFSIAPVNVARLEVAQTHADPGVATDLANIALEDDDWYFLITFYNSNAYVLAAAAWIESSEVRKQYLCDLDESDTVTQAVSGSDTADDLHTLGYARTSVWYHPSSADMLAASICGRCAPIEPGGETWALKNLAGVAPVRLTGTHRTNLQNKRANSYRVIGSAGRTFDGYTVDGDFVDTQRGLDWLENDMQVAVFNAVSGADKVPYTDPGVAVVETEVRASLDRGVTRGVLAASPAPAVTVPLVATVADDDKAARTLPDVKWSATLAGAIHKVNINGTVSV